MTHERRVRGANDPRRREAFLLSSRGGQAGRPTVGPRSSAKEQPKGRNVILTWLLPHSHSSSPIRPSGSSLRMLSRSARSLVSASCLAAASTSFMLESALVETSPPLSKALHNSSCGARVVPRVVMYATCMCQRRKVAGWRHSKLHNGRPGTDTSGRSNPPQGCRKGRKVSFSEPKGADRRAMRLLTGCHAVTKHQKSALNSSRLSLRSKFASFAAVSVDRGLRELTFLC